jgi:predicted DNA-binding transcriptional regulator YafY
MALYFARSLVRPLAGTPIHDSLEAAFQKIARILPSETKTMLGQLDQSFVSRSGPYKDYRRHRELLDLVSRAQQKRRVLKVRYRSFARRETTERRIAPYRLCYFRGGLYLIGHDDRRGEVRIFALERIQKAELTAERFQVPRSFDFEAYMESALGIFRGPETNVRIAFHGSSAHAVAERQWHPSQRIETRRNGTVVLSLRVADTLELRRWILSFGSEAEVLEPLSLRDEIRDEVQTLLDQLETWDLSPDQPFLPMLDFRGELQ